MYQQKNNTDVPPISAAVQGHLLQAYFFTNISLKILDTTELTLQHLNFCLREIPRNFIIKCACKTSCGNCYACKKNTNIYGQSIENIRTVKSENIQLYLIYIWEGL